MEARREFPGFCLGFAPVVRARPLLRGVVCAYARGGDLVFYLFGKDDLISFVFKSDLI